MTALMAPRLTLARIRGGVDALTGVAIIAPPHPAGPLQRAWLDGYLIAIAARAHPSRCSRHLVQESVSPQRHKSAVSPLFPMKPREQMPWLRVECEILRRVRREGLWLAAGDVGALIGRSARAIRIKASRLGLAQGTAA